MSTTTNHSQSELIRAAVSSTHHAGALLRLAYQALNNAGEGFDPEPEIDTDGWDQLRTAESTDDVSAYQYTDDSGDLWLVLVGTDGTGSEDSRWAVRIGDAGIDL